MRRGGLGLDALSGALGRRRPWVPVRVPAGVPAADDLEPAPERDEVYQGIGGIGLALAEVRLT